MKHNFQKCLDSIKESLNSWETCFHAIKESERALPKNELWRLLSNYYFINDRPSSISRLRLPRDSTPTYTSSNESSSTEEEEDGDHYSSTDIISEHEPPTKRTKLGQSRKIKAIESWITKGQQLERKWKEIPNTLFQQDTTAQQSKDLVEMVNKNIKILIQINKSISLYTEQFRFIIYEAEQRWHKK